MSKIIVGLDISTSKTGVAITWGKIPLAVFECETKQFAQKQKGRQMQLALTQIEKTMTQAMFVIKNHCEDNKIKEPELQIVFEQPVYDATQMFKKTGTKTVKIGRRGGDGIKYFVGLWLGLAHAMLPLAHPRLIKRTTIKGITPTAHQALAKKYCEDVIGMDFTGNKWNRENCKMYTATFAKHFLENNGMKNNPVGEDGADALSVATFGKLEAVKEKEKW